MDKRLSDLRIRNKLSPASQHAWARYAINDLCRFCRHPIGTHLLVAYRPHFYLEAPVDAGSRVGKKPRVYRGYKDDGTVTYVVRRNVVQHAELHEVYCDACAQDKETAQVVCFLSSFNNGDIA